MYIKIMYYFHLILSVSTQIFALPIIQALAISLDEFGAIVMIRTTMGSLSGRQIRPRASASDTVIALSDTIQ